MHSHFLKTAAPGLRVLGRGLLVLLGLLLAILGVDVGLGLYDEVMDPACKLGGLVTVPQRLGPGVNRIVFEERFRTTGLQFLLTGASLRDEELALLQEGLAGSVHAWLGDEPRPGLEWEYFFRTVLQPPVPLPAVESVADRVASNAVRVALGVRYDVQCEVKPTPATRPAAEDFHRAEIPAGVPLTIRFALDRPVARDLQLQLSYTKLPRSILPRRGGLRMNAPAASAASPNPRNPRYHDSQDDAL